MKLTDLEEPILGYPEKFMNDVYLVAQELYGNHYSSELEFVGYNQDHPHIWDNLLKSIQCIEINIKALFRKDASAFQLGHEVIHALMPYVRRSKTTVLEEGLATDFSLIVMDNFGYRYDGVWDKPGNYNYYYALNLVRDTKINQPDIIKQLRDIKPNISTLTSDDIKQVIGLKDSDIEDLLADFYCLPDMKKNSL
jgi:hypothetical protein